MAFRNIIQSGDEVLTKKSRPVEIFDERIHTLLDDMAETLAKADGAGLAAPQVGVLKRICIVDAGDGVIELINPEILEASGVQEVVEGCLSFPGEFGFTRRPGKVKVKAFDRFGKPFTVEGEGLKAQAFCHEIDHLNGVLFTTKIIRPLEK